MPKKTHIKVSGTWREVKNVWLKVNGVWKQGIVPKGRITGAWKEFIQYVKTLLQMNYTLKGTRADTMRLFDGKLYRHNLTDLKVYEYSLTGSRTTPLRSWSLPGSVTYPQVDLYMKDSLGVLYYLYNSYWNNQPNSIVKTNASGGYVWEKLYSQKMSLYTCLLHNDLFYFVQVNQIIVMDLGGTQRSTYTVIGYDSSHSLRSLLVNPVDGYLYCGYSGNGTIYKLAMSGFNITFVASHIITGGVSTTHRLLVDRSGRLLSFSGSGRDIRLINSNFNGSTVFYTHDVNISSISDIDEGGYFYIYSTVDNTISKVHESGVLIFKQTMLQDASTTWYYHGIYVDKALREGHILLMTSTNNHDKNYYEHKQV